MNSRFRKTILPNGLRIVSEQMDQTQTVALGVWVLCGARHEPRRLAGISHLLEHLVFKGTESRSAYDIAVQLESVGGHINAVTDREYTCYYAQCLGQHLPLGVEVLSDMVLNALIRPEDLDMEKSVVLEEILNLDDSPEDQVTDDLTEAMIPNHAMGRPILGSESSVSGMTREDVLSYREHWYNGAHIIVSVAGAVDHDALVEQLKRLFNRPSKNNNDINSQSDVILGNPVTLIKHRPISQSHVTWGCFGPAYKDHDKYALTLANTYLGGGMASLLFQRLREEKGLVYSVYSWLDLWSDTGQMGIYYGTSADRKFQSESLVEEAIVQLLNTPMDNQSLSRIRNQIIYGFQMASEDPQVRMQRLAKMEIQCGEFQEDKVTIGYINQLTSEEIQRVVNLYCSLDRWSKAIIEPPA